MDVKGAKALKERIAITSFTGKHAFLSNFHPSPVALVGGLVCPTVEHAFQASKTLSGAERASIVQLPTPGQAKRAGRRVTLRPDWEEIKIEVMHDLLLKKFAPDSELAEKLLATGDRELIEGNYWNDTFWGVCRGRGENHLGKLLMHVREELRTGEVNGI